MSTGLRKDNFQFVHKPYNLGNNSVVLRKRNSTVFYGPESLSSLATKLWELIPQPLKGETELSQFKIKIKK